MWFFGCWWPLRKFKSISVVWYDHLRQGWTEIETIILMRLSTHCRPCQQNTMRGMRKWPQPARWEPCPALPCTGLTDHFRPSWWIVWIEFNFNCWSQPRPDSHNQTKYMIFHTICAPWTENDDNFLDKFFFSALIVDHFNTSELGKLFYFDPFPG